LEEALSNSDEAARYAPKDLGIVGKDAELRSKLIQQHVQAAEQNAVADRLTQAEEQLQAALALEPTNSIVAERLGQIRAMEDNEHQSQPEESMAGVPRLQPQATKQTLDLRGDVRTTYEQVALAFGVQATFDPDLAPRNVKLHAEEVDLFTALSILELETHTFWRPINPKLFFVAPDTLEKRREYEVRAEQTFRLPASAESSDMTEILRMLREVTGSTHIELDAANRSITMRDSPKTLALAHEMLQQIEQARGEIMLDVELIEADLNKARTLGITPPSSSRLIPIDPNLINQVRAAKDLSSLITLLAGIFGSSGAGGGPLNLSSLIPPLRIVGGGKTTFLLTIPGAAADFSDALSLIRSEQRVLLRAQDGKPATFFLGERFPVTLQLLSGSLGTSTPIATGGHVSTSFPETTFTVGNHPVALAERDFNGDGLPDLAVANENDNTISILLNGNQGNFTQPTTSPIHLGKNETGPAAIASAALRNPTASLPQPASDLIIANSGSDTVSVLLGNGDGTFTEATGSPFTVGKNPSAVVIADFNGDGNLDFAVANKGDSTISVFEGDGTGKFTPFSKSPFALPNVVTATEEGPTAMVRGNFRNQGQPDLAVVNETSDTVSILLASGNSSFDGTFTEATHSPITVGKTPVAIAAGDLNGDAIPDLAVVNQVDNTITILLDNGDGTFTQPSTSPLSTARTPAGIVIANFTKGATNDLVVTNQGQGTIAIYVGLGAGTFAPRFELSTPNAPSAIVSADFNGDGLPDAALTAQGSTANQGEAVVILDIPSFATGATPTQAPYPGSEYVDLGIKVKATPALHDNKEVTLQLELEIKALAGNSINGIPILSNRTITQTVRVREDEPSLIAGLLDNQEIRAITGLPGLAQLPGAAGYLFSQHQNTQQDTELLILVTPHRLRLRPHAGRTILAGHGEGSLRGSPGGVITPNPTP